jgi:hypothetical protein
MATANVDVSAERCLAYFWHHINYGGNAAFEKRNGRLLKMQVDVPGSHSKFMVSSTKSPFPGVDGRVFAAKWAWRREANDFVAGFTFKGTTRSEQEKELLLLPWPSLLENPCQPPLPAFERSECREGVASFALAVVAGEPMPAPSPRLLTPSSAQAPTSTSSGPSTKTSGLRDAREAPSGDSGDSRPSLPTCAARPSSSKRQRAGAFPSGP